MNFKKEVYLICIFFLFLDKEDKIRTSNEVDEIISAEIPDEIKNPRLYNIVKQFMIHGPCGKTNINSPCMNISTGKCSKKFPKSFNESTNFNTTGYPLYRRRNDGKEIKFSKNRTANNTYVVPYNPYLLLKFNCHINVEVCSTLSAIKYLFKYCYKGHDCALIEMKKVNNKVSESEIKYDEIQQYINTRYVCPPEAMYRIFEFSISEMSHVIYRLAVHNENEQNVYFKEGSEEQFLNKNVDTTLTAWFKLNKNDSEARNLLYTEIARQYVFDKVKCWSKRKTTYKPVISRMYLVNPREREKFHLRLLLLHVKGATCFEDLRTVDNVVLPTFFDAAKARQLVSVDDEWDKCLNEACHISLPTAICELFAYICIYHTPINARELYEKYKNNFYHSTLEPQLGELQALRTINNILTINGFSSNDFNLPKLDEFLEYESTLMNYDSVFMNDNEVVNGKKNLYIKPQSKENI